METVDEADSRVLDKDSGNIRLQSSVILLSKCVAALDLIAFHSDTTCRSSRAQNVPA